VLTLLIVGVVALVTGCVRRRRAYRSLLGRIAALEAAVHGRRGGASPRGVATAVAPPMAPMPPTHVHVVAPSWSAPRHAAAPPAAPMYTVASEAVEDTSSLLSRQASSPVVIGQSVNYTGGYPSM
jgi:hypothetical protein